MVLCSVVKCVKRFVMSTSSVFCVLLFLGGM